jgi:hypothetical protein
MLLEQKEEGLGSEEPLLSNPNKEGILQWNVWIHPSFRDEWKHFSAIFPQRRALSWEEWERIWGEAECYMNWCMAEPEGAFSSISEERILALVADDTLREKITVQIEEDLASGALLSKLADLEKTLLYQRYIRSFLSSFVNFSHFYNPKRQSLPERGDLLMDGRLFRLSVQVLERERHKERAKDSGFFLLYIQVHTLNGDFEIATAVTGSRRGDLHVGKKGVFIQEDGVECPATVVDILNNPINIQEAFWAPFSSVQGFVQRRFESLSSKHQKELEATVEKNFSPADPSGKAALINGGVTVAALSSSFAYLIKTLSSIQLSHLFTMMLAPLLVVAFLSSFMAWWKLQNRDLGPILEASGWGINHPLYAPSWATRIFTQAAFVPKKERAQAPDLLIAYQSSVDPYGRSKAKIFLVFWIVLMVLFWYGFEYLVVLYEWSGLYQG